jgi:hypothetical protein
MTDSQAIAYLAKMIDEANMADAPIVTATYSLAASNRELAESNRELAEALRTSNERR